MLWCLFRQSFDTAVLAWAVQLLPATQPWRYPIIYNTRDNPCVNFYSTCGCPIGIREISLSRNMTTGPQTVAWTFFKHLHVSVLLTAIPLPPHKDNCWGIICTCSIQQVSWYCRCAYSVTVLNHSCYFSKHLSTDIITNMSQHSNECLPHYHEWESSLREAGVLLLQLFELFCC